MALKGADCFILSGIVGVCRKLFEQNLHDVIIFSFPHYNTSTAEDSR